jgi:hypothetical protein
LGKDLTTLKSPKIAPFPAIPTAARKNICTYIYVLEFGKNITSDKCYLQQRLQATAMILSN